MSPNCGRSTRQKQSEMPVNGHSDMLIVIIKFILKGKEGKEKNFNEKKKKKQTSTSINFSPSMKKGENFFIFFGYVTRKEFSDTKN